ncbi:alpha/beta hydrolase [Amycolatopsis sp. WAC 04197]|uniref:alpha/beta fold hydrolase n=1 Tax=Amycolatopsis sp. WAC 04197 TaxID=2203199 RepID=UPI000F79042C|nr:alpha/beta hydrolase [Amycolatopsis sp. WAC 04197]RSN49577.1 alpha/beta hydrolase [Amycolatopsis sp. WAC 04197]
MKTEVVGYGGTRIGLWVEGAENTRPIVFVHGWAQSSRAWAPQLADPALSERFRLVAMDLRGHGDSEVPSAGYDDPRVWAEDLASVLDFAGDDAIVVGWSYGGLVITDYLRVHGSSRLSGVVFVGAITEIGKNRPGGKVGPAMRDAIPAVLSDDPAVAIPALVQFSARMTAAPVSGTLTQALLGACLSTPPAVRSALFRRDVGSEDVLRDLDKPALIVHGLADAVIDPTSAEYAAGKIQGAVVRWLPEVGHLPFAEAADEFGELLRGFADQ